MSKQCALNLCHNAFGTSVWGHNMWTDTQDFQHFISFCVEGIIVFFFFLKANPLISFCAAHGLLVLLNLCEYKRMNS